MRIRMTGRPTEVISGMRYVIRGALEERGYLCKLEDDGLVVLRFPKDEPSEESANDAKRYEDAMTALFDPLVPMRVAMTHRDVKRGDLVYQPIIVTQ